MSNDNDYDFMLDVAQDIEDYRVAKKKYEEQIKEARIFAKELYKEQLNYFEHAERVALRTKVLCGFHYEIIVAYLHDVLINTDMTYDSLAEKFSVFIADGVRILTQIDCSFVDYLNSIVNTDIPMDFLTIKLINEIDNIKYMDYPYSEESNNYLNEIENILIPFVESIKGDRNISLQDLINELKFELENKQR